MKIRRKKNYIIFVLLLLVCISVGYAVINTTLNINGKSSISKNTWDVYFDNVVVKDGSVEAVKIPTIENSTTVDFEVALNLPGDYYEFTVDVVNGGSIDAMIESITKEPELTEAQEKYLNYIIEYENGEEVTTKQLVKKESFVRLKVKVELRKDIDPSDLPDVGDVLYLSFTVNYQQADESGVNVNNNGILNSGVKPVASGDINEIGTIVTIGDQQFYTIGTEGDNVKLLSMYNLYVGDECTSGYSSSCTPYGDKATGMQDSNMRGMVSDKSTRKGIVKAFSNIGTDYNGSIVEEYVNYYKTEIEKMGVEVVEARLIIKDELTHEKIGCSGTSCSNAPAFIYSTSYWTGSDYNSSDRVWCVVSDGRIGTCTNYDFSMGVRPVIIISKSLF